MTHAGGYMMDVKFAVERFRSSLFFSNKMPPIPPGVDVR